MDNQRIEKLLASLTDPDEGVRRRAIFSIGKSKDPKAIEPLIAALKDENLGTRYAAIRALSNFGHIAVPYVITKLTDSSPLVREASASILGNIRDTTAVEPLIKVLQDQHYLVRIQAIRSLGYLNDNRAIRALADGLKDSNWRVRSVIIEVLDNFPAEEKVIEVLVLSLKDSSWEVRLSAVKALGKVKNEKINMVLRETLQDRVREVRELALQILNQPN